MGFLFIKIALRTIIAPAKQKTLTIPTAVLRAGKLIRIIIAVIMPHTEFAAICVMTTLIRQILSPQVTRREPVVQLVAALSNIRLLALTATNPATALQTANIPGPAHVLSAEQPIIPHAGAANAAAGNVVFRAVAFVTVLMPIAAQEAAMPEAREVLVMDVTPPAPVPAAIVGTAVRVSTRGLYHTGIFAAIETIHKTIAFAKDMLTSAATSAKTVTTRAVQTFIMMGTLHLAEATTDILNLFANSF